MRKGRKKSVKRKSLYQATALIPPRENPDNSRYAGFMIKEETSALPIVSSAMDLLRLPPLLRRHVFQTSLRSLATSAGAAGQYSHDAPPHQTSPGLLTLTSSTLNEYDVSIPPNTTQLKYAHNFFSSAPPQLLFTAAYFRSLPPSPHPEVAFLGRSNVGKSSLLNALFGRTNVKDAHVSRTPGRTRTMNGFGVTGGLLVGAAPKQGEKEAAWKRFPRGGCVVLDMPGYGSGSQKDWGREILKVLENRKQLRRTFVLVDSEHGLKRTDIQLLTHLRRQGLNHQIVLSKVDKILYPSARVPTGRSLNNRLMKLKDLCGTIKERLENEAGDGKSNNMDLLCCSAEKGLTEKNRREKLGIEEVRWAVLAACGLECDAEGNRRKIWVQDVQARAPEALIQYE
ncbi:50S ribosome-binding GTPase [Teratosphaeria destructans]|uniref:50S ribosome-binding GTPase n=1 Tax=Teratosphaeria destructans TaxID=418781 RepID=A0A9W7SJI3_9PEZI|nr:50S ribosome-binding GTPase [Teratosphaeria destructans]